MMNCQEICNYLAERDNKIDPEMLRIYFCKNDTAKTLYVPGTQAGERTEDVAGVMLLVRELYRMYKVRRTK